MVTINGIDITKNIQESTYKMDSYDVNGTTWTDADGLTHKTIIRQRIKGSFDLVFVKGWGIDYTSFLSAIESAKNGHILTLTVSVTNTNETKTINAYYKITSNAPRKISSERTFLKVTMSVEEQ